MPRKLRINLGFTLVELSIVLVIIGLLIGGLLIGQSLIESAKINKLTSNLGQYEIATTQFRLKFKQIPGDSPSFTPPGDGNLQFNSDSPGCAIAPNDNFGLSEARQTWAHLNQSGMLNKSYPIFSPIDCGGSHSYEDFIYGKFWPHTDVEKAWMQYIMGDTDKYAIMFFNNYSGNLALDFFTTGTVGNGLDKKMSARNYSSYEDSRPGLVDLVGIGYCIDGADTAYSCNDTDIAIVGGLGKRFNYHFTQAK